MSAGDGFDLGRKRRRCRAERDDGVVEQRRIEGADRTLSLAAGDECRPLFELRLQVRFDEPRETRRPAPPFERHQAVQLRLLHREADEVLDRDLQLRHRVDRREAGEPLLHAALELLEERADDRLPETVHRAEVVEDE